MKSKVYVSGVSALLVAAFVACQAQAADKVPPTIQVAKTEAQGLASWQPTMGEGLGQMIVTELTKLDNFKVLESLALDDLRSERALGESGEVSQSESVKKGQWKGADYTFKSVVTRFGSKEQNYGGRGGVPVPFVGGFGFGVKKTENEVQIDWRIIDNASREVVKGATGRAVGVEKGSGFNWSTWHGGGFNNNSEFMESALGKATMKALAQIVEQVKVLDVGPGARSLNNAAEVAAGNAALRNIKGVVKMVDGKEIWVSLGSNNGFNTGDKVKIYKPIVKKNSKGEVVTTTYEAAGEITLSKVQKDKSMGVYTGAAAVAEDWAATDAAVDIEKLE